MGEAGQDTTSEAKIAEVSVAVKSFPFNFWIHGFFKKLFKPRLI